jgi:hypothetical protein
MGYEYECMVYGVWCMVYEYVVYEYECMVYGVWCMVYEYVVYEYECMVYGVWCMVYEYVVLQGAASFAVMSMVCCMASTTGQIWRAQQDRYGEHNRTDMSITTSTRSELYNTSAQ